MYAYAGCQGPQTDSGRIYLEIQGGTMKITYREVGFSMRKHGVCPKCRKRANRTKKFYQTLNPFNLMPDGIRKTAEEIYVEETLRAERWKALPVYHVRCEGG